VRRVLELPAYRRLLGAYALNEIALSISALTLSLLVLRRTGSSLAAAAYFLCAQFVPALAAPGLVARLDLRSPRAVLPVLYGAEALLFALLGWLASRFSLPAVLAVALLDGILALIARAIARAASVAVTEPLSLLRTGNAVMNGAFSVCLIAGPALAGGIVAAGGTVPALLINAGLFAVIAVVLAAARSLPAPDAERTGAGGHRGVREAIARVRARPVLRRLIVLQAAAVLFFAITVPVEVVLATRTLHAGAAGLGAIGALWGAGALLGSLLFARLRETSVRLLICAGAGALAAGMGVMAAAPDLGVALAGAALAGAGNGIEGVAARTAVQELTEPGWMALTMSLTGSIEQGVPGVGIVLGGTLTAISGPRLALGVAAAGAAAVTVAGWSILSAPEAGTR
jgi:hypothetical protein